MRVGACAIFVRDRRVLLGHRSPARAYYPDAWDLIGGHVRAGERPEAAMVRESWEEVGCLPTAYRFFETVEEPDPATHGPGEFHIFIVTEWLGSEPELRNEEHDDLGWFSLDDVRRLRLADSAYVDLLARVDLLR
jgi:8-oxo-dGTP diphosphatase